MVNKPKPENLNTTISISKVAKNKLRFYAKPKRITKTGTVYESDAEVAARIINEYMVANPLLNPQAHPTYPKRIQLGTAGVSLEETPVSL